MAFGGWEICSGASKFLMSCGLDWKTQEIGCLLAFSLSVKGKERTSPDWGSLCGGLYPASSLPASRFCAHPLSLWMPAPAVASFCLELICNGHLFLN